MNSKLLEPGYSESMQLRAETRISDIVLLLITEQIIDPSGAQSPLEKRGYVEQYVISLSTVTFSD